MNKPLIALSSLVMASSSVDAALIAYEGFDYTAGTTISSSLSGGTGWSNTWTSQTPQGGTNWATNATGLSYTDGSSHTLSVTGGSMFDSTTSGDGNRWRRNFAIPGGSWGTVGDPSYFSFLTDRTDTSTGTTQAWNFRLQSGTSTLAQLRNISGATDGWEISNSSNVQQASFTSLSEIAAAFVIGRITHVSGNDLLEIWLNPNDLTSLGTATMSATFTSFNALDGLSFETGSTTTGRFHEIRFGTTLGDVAPIPEPSSLAMLAGALGSLLVIRRRSA